MVRNAVGNLVILTEAQLNIATGHVNKMARRYAQAMAPCPMTRAEVLQAMFSEDVLRRAHEAYGVVTPSHEYAVYTIEPVVALGVSYEGSYYLPINPGQLGVNDNFAPMRQYIAEMKQIYLKFERVKAVMCWLNKNATASAARYYFPPILQLVGGISQFRDLQFLPSRFAEVPGISKWTGVLREATSTVGEALLLPNDLKERDRDEMWLTFGAEDRSDMGAVFKTDTLTFDL